MAKGKAAAAVQNRPMYSRISFLQQAATYLTLAQQQETTTPDPAPEFTEERANKSMKSPAQLSLARHLVTDLRSVSLKTRIRLSPALKQTICKYCDALLVEGASCTTTIENQSRDGRKSWADVLVRKCHACGNVKRQPLNTPRQKSKALRQAEAKAREKPEEKPEEKMAE